MTRNLSPMQDLLQADLKSIEGRLKDYINNVISQNFADMGSFKYKPDGSTATYSCMMIKSELTEEEMKEFQDKVLEYEAKIK